MTDVSLRNIDKRYVGTHALRLACFELRAGEVHALVGENGAGKSTLGRILAGVVCADSGDIFIDGQRVSIESPHDAQKLGIAIIHQELDLFPELTVGENVVVGNLRFDESWRVSRSKIDAFCRPYLEQVGLKCPSDVLVSGLPIAQQQLLAIARALSMNARVLIMDEPTSALPEDAAKRLFGLIASLRDRGVATVYVSHKMEEIFRIGDRITVLRDGQTVGVREAAATTPKELIRMMVGRSVDSAARSTRIPAPEVVLTVSRLTTGKLREVSFDLHAGEVLGVAGLVGSGRGALGAALFGLDRIVTGAMRLRGQPFLPGNPAAAIRQGLGLVPEDRKVQGLMMRMSVRENGALSVLSRLSRCGFIRDAEEREIISEIYRRLSLKCAPDVSVSALSGGNQQKALLARVILADPQVLFLHDPARGVDVGAKADIYALIDELAARHKGILLVSSELSELLRLSDRILVLNQGHVAALYRRSEATPELIMAAATYSVAA